MHDESVNPWRTLSSELKYENPWIRVDEAEVVNPNGGEGIYGTVHFKNRAVGVVALDEEGFVWMVGQYRYALGAYSWEIPEGGAPEGEDLLGAAKRELREETGVVAERWEVLLNMHLSNSVSDEEGRIYLARGLSVGRSSPEEVEALSVRCVSLEEVHGRVLAGEITDSLTVAGILRVWGLFGVGKVSF